PYGSEWVRSTGGKITLYCAQEKVNPLSVGNKVIHKVTGREVMTLIHLIMKEMLKVWQINKNSSSLNIGLDGQISNWAVKGFDPDSPKVGEENELIYIDTSTPMYSKGKIEAMEGELFLSSAPSFLQFFLKALFLQEVLDRYYEWRDVTIDLIANFYKEQKKELIPHVIKKINSFFSTEAKEFGIDTITAQEVYDYYQSDKMIWNIFQNSKRIDRYIKTRLLGRKYDFYIPTDIKR
ncbi:MAG: DUF6206 family protein, partial [Candidatus Hodarchaeales archaeon]